MIVAPTDREAELLDRCLSGKVTSYAYPAQREIDLTGVESIVGNVDAIFITITGDNKQCEEVAKKYGANISHYSWDKNFANARNFNFSQVPAEYDYILWVDADDVVKGAHLIREVAARAQIEVADLVIMNYNYGFDDEGNCNVRHLKTRLVRNDNGVKWVGEIHEDFAPLRQVTTHLNKEIEIIHLTDPKRVEVAAMRNQVIAEEAAKNNPKDPRVYWNLANTYLWNNKLNEAGKIYLQFLEISKSEEERFMTWCNLSSVYTRLGKNDYATEAALEALNLRPWYPDPYFVLGEICFNSGRFRAAQEYIEDGLKKEPPVLESIVWNPMDYTYNPRLLLGKVYFSINKPRDAIKQFKECLKIRPKSSALKNAIDAAEKELVKFDAVDAIYKKAMKSSNIEDIKKMIQDVPANMKYYPPLVHLRNTYLVKTKSSGKDVVFYCGYTVHQWNPEIAKTTGVGGSEEAVIQLSKRFAKAGYNVTVYANTPGDQEYEFNGVKWVPFMAWNYRDKQDITVIWRHPKALDFQINSGKIYVDVHDVVQPGEFNPARLKAVSKILFKSQTQRKYYPNIPDDKCAVIPHGLDVAEFEEKRPKVKKDLYRILNTSSPDRGLKTCMDIILAVYEKLPDDLKPKLKFSQYYGFDIWDSEFSDNMDMVKWKNEAMEQMHKLMDLGIMTKDSGVRVSQDVVTNKYLESGVILYPSEFFEIGYIGGIKGMLGGCIPFTTDVFAQGEFAKDGYIVHSKTDYTNWVRDIATGVDYGVQEQSQIDQFVDGIVDYFKNPAKYDKIREELIEYARSNFNWDTTSDSWVSLFNQ